MKKYIKNIFIFGLTILVYIGFNQYSQNYFKNDLKKEKKTLNNQVKERPDELASLVMSETAKKRAVEILNESKNKKEEAMSFFVGFYLRNTRAKTDFCNKFDVDISTFTDEMKRIHSKELAMYQEVLPDITLDKAYGILKNEFENLTEIEFRDAYSAYNVSPKEGCLIFKENAVEIAKNHSLEKSIPEAYKIIHQ